MIVLWLEMHGVFLRFFLLFISPEYEDARDDSAAKLGCSYWCDFPLNVSERISEQALIFLLEGRPM